MSEDCVNRPQIVCNLYLKQGTDAKPSDPSACQVFQRLHLELAKYSPTKEPYSWNVCLIWHTLRKHIMWTLSSFSHDAYKIPSICPWPSNWTAEKCKCKNGSSIWFLKITACCTCRLSKYGISVTLLQQHNIWPDLFLFALAAVLFKAQHDTRKSSYKVSKMWKELCT